MSPSRPATSAPYGSDPTGDHFRSSGFWMRSAARVFCCSATSRVEIRNATTAIATDPVYPRYVRLIGGPPEWYCGHPLSTRLHGFQALLPCAVVERFHRLFAAASSKLDQLMFFAGGGAILSRCEGDSCGICRNLGALGSRNADVAPERSAGTCQQAAALTATKRTD